jgi:hypothetical protein
MRQRTVIGTCCAIALALVITACGESPTAGPSPLSSQAGGSMLSTAGVTCSDAATMVTKNYSPIGRNIRVDWTTNPGSEVFQVEVSYSRTGRPPLRVIDVFTTEHTFANIADNEDGGFYFVRVRVIHSACGDADGAWSRTVIIDVVGREDRRPVNPPVVTPPDETPDEDPEPEPEDDGDNGHGNDDDGDDDSNPGQGDGGGPGDNPGNGGGDDDDDSCPVSTPSGKPAVNPGNGNPGGNDDPQPCHGNDDGNPGQGHN